MTTSAIRKIEVALALEAYGIQLRLWKERDERKWGATVRDNDSILHISFEEDNLTMAKLHLLGEARNRALKQRGGAALPGCDAFMDSWKPVARGGPISA